MAVFMLETLKLSKTLKSSRDDFNVLDNFNVSSIKRPVALNKDVKMVRTKCTRIFLLLYRR